MIRFQENGGCYKNSGFFPFITWETEKEKHHVHWQGWFVIVQQFHIITEKRINVKCSIEIS